MPNDTKIHLIGHSIGSWIVLELLKIPEIRVKVINCYLLFPTIERLVTSRNGIRITRLWMIWPTFKAFYNFFNFFPSFLKRFFISIHFWITGIPKTFMDTTLKLTKPCVIDKVMFMMNDEMEKVKELDVENLKRNKDRIKLYYGTTDGWVPTSYYHEIIKTIPGINAELCTKKIAHSFVLNYGPLMGKMVASWISDKKLYYL